MNEIEGIQRNTGRTNISTPIGLFEAVCEVLRVHYLIVGKRNRRTKINDAEEEKESKEGDYKGCTS